MSETGKLRARLSKFWLRRFTPEQRKVAEYLIRDATVKTRSGGTVIYTATYGDCEVTVTGSPAAQVFRAKAEGYTRSGSGRSAQKAICQFVFANWRELQDLPTPDMPPRHGEGKGDGDGDGTPDGREGKPDGQGEGDGDGKGDGDGAPPKSPPKLPKCDKVDSPSTYLGWIRKLRKYCEEKAADGEAFDEIGNRPLIFGLKMGKVGIPYHAALDALTQHWPDEAREDNGISSFDPLSFGDSDDVPEDHHPAFPYVLALLKAKVNPYLWGPAGTGKSHLVKQCAEALSLGYGNTSVTKGITPSNLLGRITLDGYRDAAWVRDYVHGGVHSLEELDGADPNVIAVINTAIENGEFDNPISGDHLVKSDDFYLVGTGNTLMLGANRFYTGRTRLDFATLDRFRMGRVHLTIVPRLEEYFVEHYS